MLSILPMQIRVLDRRYQDHPDWLPSYGSSQSAGLDLRALPEHDLVLQPGECQLVPTGLSIYLQDPRYVGLVFPRSSTGHKKHVVLGNSTGVIDSDYQGPLMLSLWNRGQEPVTIEVGERVAQYVIVPCMKAHILMVDSFSEETSRGEGGFGSTGNR